jgi:D-3-phosphoglycerate dehydrogenase
MSRNRRSQLVLFTDVPPDPWSEQMLDAAGVAYRYVDDADGLRAHGADASVVINGFTRIDETILSAMPRLELVCLTSMGTDMVDLDAAARRGVVVTNIPGTASAPDVAVHAFALMLDTLKGVTRGAAAVAAGVWDDYRPRPFPRIGDLTLGVLGLGKVGMELIERFGGQFGRTIGHDPFVPLAPRAGLERVDRETLLRESDLLSLHLPLTPETARMIDATAIATMRHGAILVNVSRGGLVDSDAVAAALDSGRLSAFAADVLEDEPPAPGHPLVGHRSATITPHIAYLSRFTEQYYRELPISNAIAHAAGEAVRGIVPPLAAR